MIQRLLPKKRFGSSKGISTVIATIILVVAIFAIFTNVFLSTIARSAVYNEAVKQSHKMDADRSSEVIVAYNTNYSVSRVGKVDVKVIISNQGPLPTQIITAWVVAEGKYGFNDTLNINLNPGDTVTPTIEVSVPGVFFAGEFNGRLVTARGNLIALQKEITIVTASVAYGVGSIMMDFDKFKYYYLNKTDGTLFPCEGIASFNVLVNNDIIFRVLLSNYDQLQRDIILDNRSVLWLYTSKSSSPAVAEIVNVENGKIETPYKPITLPYSEKCGIYFKVDQSKLQSLVPTSCAVNLLLIGKIGDQDYGQNIPFASIYISK